MKYFAIAAVLAVLLVILFTLTGGPETLGAQPQWAVRVGFYGLVPGVGLAWALVRLGSTVTAARVLAPLWLCSGLAVVLGKQRFVLSFAEDAVAGRFWFLGWIALIAILTATLAVIIRKAVKQHQQT